MSSFRSSGEPSFAQQEILTIYEVTSIYIEGVVLSPGGELPLQLSYMMNVDSEGRASFYFEPGHGVVFSVRLGSTARSRPVDPNSAGPQVPEPKAALVFGAGLLVIAARRLRTF